MTTSTVETERRASPVRTFSRVAAFVFAAYTIYPLVTKLLQDRLAEDWAHTALHALSSLAAAYAGWLSVSDAPARLYTWAIAISYGALGIVGWFTPGLFLDTPFRIPLGPAENVFHVLVGGGAISSLVLDSRR